MSNVRPMVNGKRRKTYLIQNYNQGAQGADRGWFGNLTPRQRRRINHKLNKADKNV